MQTRAPARLARTFLLAALCAAFAISAAPPPAYHEGEVWEYHTRPGEEGSLLKIQKIERPPDAEKFGPIYHISLIGLHFKGMPVTGEMAHAPFSKAALDVSVTQRSASRSAFPDASEGIAQWRQAHGGVFTISVADAVKFAEQTMRQQMPAEAQGN